jgi:hypothetical protein
MGFGPVIDSREAAWLRRLLEDPNALRRVRGYQARMVLALTLITAVLGLLNGVRIWWAVALGAFVFFTAVALSQTTKALERARHGLERWQASEQAGDA